MLESLAPTKLLSIICDIEMGRHLYVPAGLKLLTSCYTTLFHLKFSIAFRWPSDQLSTHSVWFPWNLNQLSIQVRWFPTNFWHMFISFSHNFDHFGNSTSTNYDDFAIWSPSPRWSTSLGQMFCVNRGLWDNLSLPRTTPDNHVELSSVCVCVCVPWTLFSTLFLRCFCWTSSIRF